MIRSTIPFYRGDEFKYPRKLKKKILGTRMTKKQLRKLLETITMIENSKGVAIDILPYYFCPYCGCESTDYCDHGETYPDIWTQEFCRRCGKMVAEQDNGYPYHVLEFYVSENRITRLPAPVFVPTVDIPF